MHPLMHPLPYSRKMNAEQEQIRSANKPLAPSTVYGSGLGQGLGQGLGYSLRRPSIATAATSSTSATTAYGTTYSNGNGIGNGASAGYSAVKKDFPVLKVGDLPAL